MSINKQKNLTDSGVKQKGLFGKLLQNDGKYDSKRLILMWGMIFLGYFLFVSQWYSISNFTGSIAADNANSTGWGAAFFEKAPNALVSGATNWMITLGRAFGSIMAGWLIAKIGHKYSVVTVLGLMIVSFPFLIIAQNADWNALSIAGGATTDANSGVAVAGFSLFVIFRTFLAIGGTTLITYTNSVIAKMEAQQLTKCMISNQFGFNSAAFFANIFFVIPGASAAVTSNPSIWTGILSSFLVLTFILLVLYLLYGVEVVPVNKNAHKSLNPSVSFLDVFKQKSTWKLALLFSVWLISVVFINSSTMRTFIEQSPANFQALVIDNLVNNASAASMGKSVSYYWIWPAFICAFVFGFLIGAFWLAGFCKTIFERKAFSYTMFGLGYGFMMASILIAYFGGYGNPAAVAFMLIFITLSGTCLWSIQPVILTIPQQLRMSDAKYVGILAGLVWGIGYLGYTVGEATMGSIISYVDPFKFGGNVKELTLALNPLDPNTLKPIIPNMTYEQALNAFNFQVALHNPLIKSSETIGAIVMIVVYWSILSVIFILIHILPSCGYRNKNGEFIEFTQRWTPFSLKNWNVQNKEFLITTQLAK